MMPSREIEDIINTSAGPAQDVDAMDQSPTIEHVEFCAGELPSRPCTPLGFNSSKEAKLRSISNSCTAADISESTLSLSERLPIPPIASATDHTGNATLPTRPNVAQRQNKVESNSGLSSLHYRFSHENRGGTIVSSDDEDTDSDDFDSDCSSCESSDEDSDVSVQSSPPMTPPSSPPRSVSRISFPFTCKSPQRVTASSPTPPPPVSRRSPPPPPVKRKFTCLPSPLSSNCATRRNPFSVSPPRHNYSDHGYSRHALVNLKWFWSTREDEWDGDTADFAEAASFRDVSAIVSTSAATAPGPISPGSGAASLYRAQDDRGERPLPLPPLSIHPRRGDLGALRDPWCARIDRCFVTLPVWTISKTLWMYDLHIEADRRAKEEEFDTEEDVESEAETSASVGFSDDSDTTLVESESEGDLTRVVERQQQKKEAVLEDPFSDEQWARCASASRHGSSTAGPSSLHSYPITKVDSDPDLAYCSKASPFLDPPSASRTPQWTTNWYRRWELLIELTRRDQERKRAEELGAVVMSCADAEVTAAKASRFFIPGEPEADDSEADVWSEAWDPVSGDDAAALKPPLPSSSASVSVLSVPL